MQANVPLTNVAANTLLLEEGQVSSQFFFVAKGSIRMYYLVDGQEKNTFFYEANNFVSSYESFTKQVPARHYLQTLEPCELATFNAPVVGELLQQFPRFEFLARVAMEAELSIYQNMLASLLTLNPTQRYLELQEKQPDLLQKIPQYHIATYLGVTPETLSRIRQRIARSDIS